MATIDLNLIVALDVLLAERSVTVAAKRLGLSPSAASRTLSRLRAATGDPLLVPAGRSLVPTPYAEQLADRVHALAGEARAVLSPAAETFNPLTLERAFTIRANEAFLTTFGAAVVTAVIEAAPSVRVCFTPKPDKDAAPLRDGRVDLEIGTPGTSAAEARSRLICYDRFVGAVRLGHPLLDEPITPSRYAAGKHVITSRRGATRGPVDDALQKVGLCREVVTVVPDFVDALAVARGSDLIALVSNSCFAGRDATSQGLAAFDLPVSTPELAIKVMWHPRLDADPAHRWLRETLIETCQSTA